MNVFISEKFCHTEEVKLSKLRISILQKHLFVMTTLSRRSLQGVVSQRQIDA